jgi:hypothetical protein
MILVNRGEVTEIAAAALANSAEATIDFPSQSPTARAPTKQSPAAVVSTAGTGQAGIFDRHPGQCALQVAGVPPGQVSYLDAVGV